MGVQVAHMIEGCAKPQTLDKRVEWWTGGWGGGSFPRGLCIVSSAGGQGGVVGGRAGGWYIKGCAHRAASGELQRVQGPPHCAPRPIPCPCVLLLGSSTGAPTPHSARCRGFHIVHSDQDVIWLRDPLPLFAKHPHAGNREPLGKRAGARFWARRAPLGKHLLGMHPVWAGSFPSVPHWLCCAALGSYTALGNAMPCCAAPCRAVPCCASQSGRGS